MWAKRNTLLSCLLITALTIAVYTFKKPRKAPEPQVIGKTIEVESIPTTVAVEQKDEVVRVVKKTTRLIPTPTNQPTSTQTDSKPSQDNTTSDSGNRGNENVSPAVVKEVVASTTPSPSPTPVQEEVTETPSQVTTIIIQGNGPGIDNTGSGVQENNQNGNVGTVVKVETGQAATITPTP